VGEAAFPKVNISGNVLRLLVRAVNVFCGYDYFSAKQNLAMGRYNC
jgi:hypothetical protein